MRMYSSSQVCRIHVELTTRCNAACPMCPRMRSGGLPNPNLPLTELTLADFSVLFPPTLLRSMRQFLFCGNYGDALTARDLLPILEYLKTEQPGLRIKLVTNGSGRDKAFWTRLARLVTMVRFSIDGLEDTNAIYRRRTNWNRILQSVRTYCEAGGCAEWDFLVFRHNEHQIEQAQKLAASLGVAVFHVKKSQRFLVEGRPQNRFPVLLPDGRVDCFLEMPGGSEHTNKSFLDFSRLGERGQTYDAYLHTTTIACKAVRDQQVYVSATGHMFPCCWLGQIYESWPSPMAEEILARLAELPGGLSDLDLRQHSFAEIIDGPFFQHWVGGGFAPSSPLRLSACARMCGEIDSHSRQWERAPS